MKALTLTQPWASLVAVGAKRIETRSWSTSYLGVLAIHAAKGLVPVGGARGLNDLRWSEPFATALVGESLPLGAFVAVCELAAVIPTEVCPVYSDPPHERGFGDYTPGRFAWLLVNVRRLPEPIPHKGALGLWTVPADVAVRIGRP